MRAKRNTAGRLAVFISWGVNSVGLVAWIKAAWLSAWWVDRAVINHRGSRSAALFSSQCETRTRSSHTFHSPSSRPEMLLKPMVLIWKWLCAWNILRSFLIWLLCYESFFISVRTGRSRHCPMFSPLRVTLAVLYIFLPVKPSHGNIWGEKTSK